MSDQERQPNEDLLDRATLALRDMPTPDGPSPELLAKTLAVLQGSSSKPIFIQTRRRLLMKRIAKLSVAAVLVVGLGVTMWSPHPWNGSVAFADVIQNVTQAKSVRLKLTSEARAGAHPSPVMDATMTISGDKMRLEVATGTVVVVDQAAGEMVTLTPQIKKAIRSHISKDDNTLRDQNPIAWFRTIPVGSGKKLGRTEIDGKSLEGYEVVSDGRKMIVYVDPKTELPVQIEASVNVMGQQQAVTFVMKGFEWDIPVDEGMFHLSIPEGYDVQDVSMNIGNLTEKDLLDTLRYCASVDGSFPDTFDAGGIGQAIQKTVMSRLSKPEAMGKDGTPDKAQFKKQQQEAMNITRGMLFVMKGSGKDFNYAGKDVKLGEPNTPILWYQPEKSETYRVVYADLTVKADVKVSDLPKVDAVKLSLPPDSMPRHVTPK